MSWLRFQRRLSQVGAGIGTQHDDRGCGQQSHRDAEAHRRRQPAVVLIAPPDQQPQRRQNADADQCHRDTGRPRRSDRGPAFAQLCGTEVTCSMTGCGPRRPRDETQPQPGAVQHALILQRPAGAQRCAVHPADCPAAPLSRTALGLGRSQPRPSHFHQPAVDEIDFNAEICIPTVATASMRGCPTWPHRPSAPPAPGGPPWRQVPPAAQPPQTRVATRSPDTYVAGESLRQPGGEFDERQPGLLLQRGEIEGVAVSQVLIEGDGLHRPNPRRQAFSTVLRNSESALS